MQDDFATFRAAHSTSLAAIENCERPDWIVQLVWDAVADHKAAIKFGAEVAAIVSPRKGMNSLAVLRPTPGALEAIDVWIERTTPEERKLANNARAWMLASAPAGVLAILCDQFVVSRWLGRDLRIVSICAMVVLLAFVIAQPIKRYFARAIQHQVGNLDDESALQMILAETAKGMKRNPRFVPVAMKFIRRNAKELVMERQREL